MSAERFRLLLLARFPFFASLRSDQLEALLGEVQFMEVPQGSTVFNVDQPCHGFPLLLDGTVRVTKIAPNGREIVLYRVEPGQGCILSGGCLLGDSTYCASAIAEENVTVARVPPALFQKLILEFPPFRAFVFGMYGRRLAEVMELVEEVAFRRLDARLAQLLIRQGPELRATHQKLAEELGSVREVVSRMLRTFEERGWIRLERERITVLDRNALLRQAHGSL